MTKRDRLGRGLGALLGEALGEDPNGTAARQLAVGAITPNPLQPRREFDEEELAELAASIRENGLLQPIVVRPAPEGGTAAWELVAGERRWRAATRLGWREIPALIREVDDRALLVLALVENLQREGLSVLEEAKGYQQLADEFGLSQQQIAESVGRDRSTVTNALRLLQLPASVRRLVGEGRLTAGHARALLGIGQEQRLIALARQAAQEGWSVREVEARVRGTRGNARPRRGRATPTRDPAERRLEDELQRVLGAPARIRQTRGARGRIEIPFHSADEFERLYELLTGGPAHEVVS